MLLGAGEDKSGVMDISGCGQVSAGGAQHGGAGGAGGPGVVIVRVPSEFALSGTPGPAFCGSTHPGGDKIGKFTASGTLTITEA